MNFILVVEVFINTVSRAMSSRSPSGAKFYVETKRGGYINFKPRVFRSMLRSLVESDGIAEKYMEYFRRLKFIVVEKPDRFTNIQWINKKTSRVITVDKEIFEALIELMKKGSD